jgi:hypothetical protein
LESVVLAVPKNHSQKQKKIRNVKKKAEMSKVARKCLTIKLAIFFSKEKAREQTCALTIFQGR